MVVNKTVLGLLILGLLMGLATAQLVAASYTQPGRFQSLGAAMVSGTSGSLTGFSTLTITITSTAGPVFLFQLQVELSPAQSISSGNSLSAITIDGGLTPMSNCPPSARGLPTPVAFFEVMPLITPSCFPGLFVTEPLGNSAIAFAKSISIGVYCGCTFDEGTATAEATMSGPLIASVTVTVTAS